MDLSGMGEQGAAREKSSIVTRERALACVAELSCGRGPVELPDAGHHVMPDEPVALIATLQKLLASHAR
jgi:hypothetical protein